MAAGGGTKAVVAALAANTGIAVVKFGAWGLTMSASMLAEAIHSVADAGNQGLLLVGGRRAEREATEEHPFGYGRERYVYAFIVSIVLFTVGGLFALYEAYHKLLELAGGHGDGGLLESRWKWLPLVVLGAAIVMEGLSFRTAIIETNKVRGDHSWWGFIRRAKAPELPVILLEDFAALLGLAVALVGVGLALLTHNLYFDVVGSAVIGGLLVAVAVILGVEVKSLLVGEAATPRTVARIRDAVASVPGVEQVIHLKTLHIAPEEVLVAAKIAVPPGVSAATVAATIDAAERALRAAEPMATQVFLEPDIHRDDYVPDERPEAPHAPSH
jgi:cation diffusion facilitator family transporter